MYSYEQVDKANRDFTRSSLEMRAEELLKKAHGLSDQIEQIGAGMRHDINPHDFLVSLAHLKGAIDELEKLETELDLVAGDLGATRAELADLRK